MCWFTGISYTSSEDLSRLSQAVKVRAIDTEQYYESENFSLYHWHLKISDLDKDTSQPHIHNNILVSLVWEIYNWEELCKDYNIAPLSTECEIISQLFQKLWESFIEKINGEFSICVFDIEKKHNVSL